MMLIQYNRRSSIPVGPRQSPLALLNPCRRSSIPLALLSLDWCFNISFSAPYYLFCPCSSSRMGAPQSPPQPWLGAPLFHSRHFTSHPVRHCSAWMACSAALALLNPHWHSLACICAPQFHSASPSALPLTASHDIRYSSFPGGAPLFPPNSSYCLSNSILMHHKLTSIPTLLDITNQAKQHWNSISPTLQARIIQKYKERLQLLWAIDELCIPAFVSPDEMGDLVDDIETMFDWYHSNCLVGLLFPFYLLSFLNHSPFSLGLP